MEEFSNTTGLEGLVGPVGHCCQCSCGSGSPQSVRKDLWALQDDPDASAHSIFALHLRTSARIRHTNRSVHRHSADPSFAFDNTLPSIFRQCCQSSHDEQLFFLPTISIVSPHSPDNFHQMLLRQINLLEITSAAVLPASWQQMLLSPVGWHHDVTDWMMWRMMWPIA